MSRRRPATVFAVLVLFLTGLLGACGSDSGKSDTTPTVPDDASTVVLKVASTQGKAEFNFPAR